MAKIMHMREQDVELVARHVSLNESDPALIAPNIAEKPAPASKELYEQRKSRFVKSSDAGETFSSEATEATVHEIRSVSS